MISLYGSLARVFEKKYKVSAKNIKINVQSGLEMMKAMEANFKGFRQMIKKKGYYKLSRGKDSMSMSKSVIKGEIEVCFSEKDWHIMPVAAGNSGAFKAVLGAVLVVVGVVFRQPWAIRMGIGLMVGGVAQMLTPGPSQMDYGANEKPDERRSYLFSGPTNAVEPGTTIPVIYGEVYVGSITVSGGLAIGDI